MAAGEEKLRLVLSAIDKTAAPLRSVNRRIEGMLAPIRKVRNAFASLAREAGLPKLGAQIARIGSAVKYLAVGDVAAGAGILAFVEKTAEAADNLAEFTRLVGINVEDFQELQFAAKRAGIESETFAGAIKMLSRNVGQAQAGTGRLAGLLKKVAPSVLKQIQGARDTGEALEIVLATMRKLPIESRRNAIASAAFGNAQLALLATLSPDELQRFREEARRLGIVLSSDAASGAESLMDNVDDLKASVLGLGRSIATALFPDMEAATGQLLLWIKANRELIVSGGREAILQFAAGMKALGVFLVENVPKLQQFVTDVGGIKTVLIAIAAISLAPLLQTIIAIGVAMGPWYLAATAIAAAIGYVATHMDDVKAGLRAGAGAFGFDVTPQAPVVPGRAAAVDAQAAVNAQKLDAALKVDIDLSDKRARVAKIMSTNPAVQFGNLSTGVALGAQ